MKRLTNQKGSVMLLVLIIAVVFAIIVIDLCSQIASLSQTASRYAASNENIRVGDEMSKIVSHAYEYGVQLAAQGGVCPGIVQTAGTTSLCFAPNDSNYANCVTTKFNSTARICLLITDSTLVAKNDGNYFYQFHAQARRTNASAADVLDFLIPTAFASNATSAMPPDPTGPSNPVTPYNCTGTAADPALCRKCAPGLNNFCYEIAFCPVQKSSCTAAEEIKIDMMISR